MDDATFAEAVVDGLARLGPDGWREAVATVRVQTGAPTAELLERVFARASEHFTAEQMAAWWSGTLPATEVQRILHASPARPYLMPVQSSDTPARRTP